MSTDSNGSEARRVRGKRVGGRRLWLWISWVAVVVLLGVGAVAVFVSVSSGKTRLIGVQYGAVKALEYRSTLWEWIALSARYQGLMPQSLPLPAPALPQALGVWIKMPAKEVEPDTFALLTDEHGCEVSASTSHVIHLVDGTVFRRFETSVFPRRAPVLTLQVFTRVPNGAWTLKQRFSFKNPVTGNFPQPKAEALPVSQRAGKVEFRLTDLKSGMMPRRVTRYALESFTRATFRVAEDGRTVKSWHPDSLVIADAAGNQWSPPYNASPFFDSEGEAQHVFFSHRLWPEEKAWKLRVSFARNDTASFSPEERFAVANVAVPQGVIDRRSQPSSPAGIAVLAFAPPGLPPGEWQGGQVFPWLSTLVVQVENPKLDQRLTLLSVTDKRGKTIKGKAIRQLMPPNSGNKPGRYAFGLRLDPSSERLSLQFALHRSHTVDFTASPN